MESILSNAEPVQEGNRRPDRALSTAALKDELQAARDRVGRLEKQIRALELALSGAREEEKLLERLIVVRHSGTPGGMYQASERSGVNTRIVGSPAVASVVEILTETRRPLHISELMRLLGDRNVKIPGAGRQANLIAGLRRDSRIVRPSRGMYGLAEWGLPDLTLRRRRPRRRSKRVSRAMSTHKEARSRSVTTKDAK